MTAQLVPYLAVRDARAAMAWYTDALGAQVVGDPYVMDDDRIGHAELTVAGATLYLADEYPELGLTGPDDGRVSVSLHLTVPTSTPRSTARCGRRDARAAGRRRPVRPHRRDRRPVRPPLDAPDAGAATASGPRPGDAVYLTLQVPDGARARDFYEAVLGWSAVPGRVADGWQVEGTTPMVGIGGGAAEPAWCRCTPSTTSRSRSRPSAPRAEGRRDRAAALRPDRRCAATTRACRSTSVSWAETRPRARRGSSPRYSPSCPSARAARRPAAGRGARAAGGRPPG